MADIQYKSEGSSSEDEDHASTLERPTTPPTKGTKADAVAAPAPAPAAAPAPATTTRAAAAAGIGAGAGSSCAKPKPKPRWFRRPAPAPAPAPQPAPGHRPAAVPAAAPAPSARHEFQSRLASLKRVVHEDAPKPAAQAITREVIGRGRRRKRRRAPRHHRLRHLLHRPPPLRPPPPRLLRRQRRPCYHAPGDGAADAAPRGTVDIYRRGPGGWPHASGRRDGLAACQRLVPGLTCRRA